MVMADLHVLMILLCTVLALAVAKSLLLLNLLAATLVETEDLQLVVLLNLVNDKVVA